jgi:tRNA dimethylallyltransferase
MIERGLIDEVRHLRTRPNLHPELPSMRSVGYRQVWAWLDAPTTLESLVTLGTAATRQLAKRQLTWLRSDPDRVVIDCLSQNCVEKVRQHIQDSL